MMKNSAALLSWCAVALCSINISLAYGYRQYYMRDYCNGILNLTSQREDYGLLGYSPNRGYEGNIHCQMVVMAPPSKGLAVRFTMVDIRDSWDCQRDRLKIYTDFGDYKLMDILCGDSTPRHSHIFPLGHMTLEFKTSSKGSNRRRGFQLVFTSYRKGWCNTTKDEIQCRKHMPERRCIPRKLLCDHLDNCGDGSDESHSYSGCPYRMSSSRLAGLVLGILIAVSLVSLIVCCSIQHCQGRKPRSRTPFSTNTVAYFSNGQEPEISLETTSPEIEEPPPPYTACVADPTVGTSGVSNMAFSLQPPPYSSIQNKEGDSRRTSDVPFLTVPNDKLYPSPSAGFDSTSARVATTSTPSPDNASSLTIMSGSHVRSTNQAKPYQEASEHQTEANSLAGHEDSGQQTIGS